LQEIFTNTIVVQEEGDNPQAIRISIDAGSLSGVYPVGQRVSVKLNGLWIGTFGQSAQIGSYFLSSTASRVNNDPAYNGEPGRIAKVITDQHIVPYGLPDPNAVVPKEMTIAQIKAAGTELHNVLVIIKDATFTGKGQILVNQQLLQLGRRFLPLQRMALVFRKPEKLLMLQDQFLLLPANMHVLLIKNYRQAREILLH
jgi:hypothetical protein